MPGYLLRVDPVPRNVSRPLWAALIREREPRTIGELHVASGAHPNAIQLRLRRWVRAGIVHEIEGRPKRFIMPDPHLAPPTPPTVNAAGVPGPLRTATQRLWTAMRVLKRFDVPTLMIAAQASRRATEAYINFLRRAGYVEIDRKAWGRRNLYRLVIRSGPVAPSVRQRVRGQRQLYDHNTGTVIDISPGVAPLKRPLFFESEA